MPLTVIHWRVRRFSARQMAPRLNKYVVLTGRFIVCEDRSAGRPFADTTAVVVDGSWIRFVDVDVSGCRSASRRRWRSERWPTAVAPSLLPRRSPRARLGRRRRRRPAGQRRRCRVHRPAGTRRRAAATGALLPWRRARWRRVAVGGRARARRGGARRWRRGLRRALRSSWTVRADRRRQRHEQSAAQPGATESARLFGSDHNHSKKEIEDVRLFLGRMAWWVILSASPLFVSRGRLWPVTACVYHYHRAY